MSLWKCRCETQAPFEVMCLLQFLMFAMCLYRDLQAVWLLNYLSGAPLYFSSSLHFNNALHGFIGYALDLSRQ